MMLAVFLLIGAVNGASQSAVIQPSDYVVDGIDAQFGAQCNVSEDEWLLHADTTDTITDWAIQLDLSSPYALSSGLSTIAFEINGEGVHWQGDMFMGFGDGEKYISFLTDFDGGVNNKEKVRGIQIWPPCEEEGGSLAVGSVSDVLSDTSSYHDNSEYAVRDALAGGDRNNWEKLGGTTVHNGATWPVTMEIVNDMDANQVTFRFSSETVTRECTYSDSFSSGAFVYGMLPDTQDGAPDNFHIYSIGVNRTSETTTCSASICAHGDNDLHVFVSYDGGSSYESLSYKAGWAATTELESVFAPPFYATLRFEVDDYKHTGGFMATVSVECDDGYEATYITDKGNTMFDVVYALSGNTVMSEFYKFGEEGSNNWITRVNSETVECMSTDAYWMWNGLDSDNVVFELELRPPMCSASVCAHGDNELDVSLSYDGGDSYESLSYKAGWAATTELALTDFSPPATLRFEVDDYDHRGGFMATVSVECDDGYEATFITDKGNTMFDVVYALSGNTVMSEFYKFGEEGNNNWITRVNSETVECMNTDAYWMWNGLDTDDVVFELDLFSSADTAVSAASASVPLNEKRRGHGHDDVSWKMPMDIGKTARNMPIDSAMVVLQLKDILIICLVIANVIALTILAAMYCKRSSTRIQYKAVVMASDSEKGDLM